MKSTIDPQPKRLYRIREVCELLGMSAAFVKAACARGAIKSVRVGCARRVPATEVDRIATHGLDPR